MHASYVHVQDLDLCPSCNSGHGQLNTIAASCVLNFRMNTKADCEFYLL